MGGRGADYYKKRNFEIGKRYRFKYDSHANGYKEFNFVFKVLDVDEKDNMLIELDREASEYIPPLMGDLYDRSYVQGGSLVYKKSKTEK